MTLLADLEALLGDGGVLTGDAVSERTAGIWRRDAIQAGAILRPRSTAEVAGVLRLCHAAGQPVVAHGGLTGLVEGSLTGPDDLALSLERMRTIEAIDTVNRTMTVQAGVVLQQAQEAATAAGLFLPLDLGGRGSCTVGGNIATNAGGNRVIRYGMTRESVLGLEVVLADGEVVSSLHGMIKNNAGYDLKHWFIGSEGTLGVVTRAVLRLREQPRSEDTVLVAVDDFAALTGLLKHMDAALGGTLSAFEVMWADYYDTVTTAPAPHAAPLAHGHPYYVLVEALGGDPEADHVRMEQALGTAFEAGLVADAVLARSGREREALWAIRDDVAQTFRDGPTIAFDVSLPIAAMEAYVAEVRSGLAAAFAEHRLHVFGHLGDGNLHFVVGAGKPTPEVRHRVEACVYEPLRAIGGSVSAEHGVGLEKKAWLDVTRSPAELALMARLKAALDPQDILNPGKVLGEARVTGGAGLGAGGAGG